jgi:hypothetical protein
MTTEPTEREGNTQDPTEPDKDPAALLRDPDPVLPIDPEGDPAADLKKPDTGTIGPQE